MDKDIAMEHTLAIRQAALGLAFLETNQLHIGARSRNARRGMGRISLSLSLDYFLSYDPHHITNIFEQTQHLPVYLLKCRGEIGVLLDQGSRLATG